MNIDDLDLIEFAKWVQEEIKDDNFVDNIDEDGRRSYLFSDIKSMLYEYSDKHFSTPDTELVIMTLEDVGIAERCYVQPYGVKLCKWKWDFNPLGSL